MGAARTAAATGQATWSALQVAPAPYRRCDLYLLRSGCAWRMLPHDYPPYKTVFWHFTRWKQTGLLRSINTVLRTRTRVQAGRAPAPSAGIIDSQSVKTTNRGGPERGYDGAKHLAGRKRHILVDTTGLVLDARVHVASTADRDGGKLLLGPHVNAELPHLELVWADAGYRGSLPEWVRKERGWHLEIVHHPDRQLWRYGLVEKPEGFQVMPRRWVVERTFAWLSRYRRLSKDYELLPETSEAMIYGAMTRLMQRRLTLPKPVVAQAA